MELAKEVTNDDAFGNLVTSVFNNYKDEPLVQHYFIEHALRSDKFGHNAKGWAMCAEACAKAQFLNEASPMLLTDRFILTLALFLAEYHALKEEEKKIAPGSMVQ